MYTQSLPSQALCLWTKAHICVGLTVDREPGRAAFPCRLQHSIPGHTVVTYLKPYHGVSWKRGNQEARRLVTNAQVRKTSNFGSPYKGSNDKLVVEVPPWLPNLGHTLKGVAALVLLEKLTGVVLGMTSVAFPSPVALLTVIATVMAISRSSARKVYEYHAPAITFFDTWLASFFVPCVAGVALAPLPSSGTLIKATIVLAGFYLYTLGAAAFIVLDLQKFLGERSALAAESKRSSMTDAERVARIGEGIKSWTRDVTGQGAKVLAEAATVTRDADIQKVATIGAQVLETVSDSISVGPPPKALKPPFQELHWNFFAAAVLLAPSFYLPAMCNDPVAMAPGFLVLTAAMFRACKRMPLEVRRWISPTVGAGIGMALVGAGYGNLWLSSWRRGIQVYLGGAGAVLIGLIGPAVASLGFKVYTNRAILEKALLPLVISSVLLVPSGLLLVAVLGRLVGLDPTTTLSIMPATTTLGLAREMGRTLRADQSFIVAGVTILGALGIEAGRAILDRFNVNNPTARGISVGASSHAIGTSALVAQEPQAGSVAGLGFALKGTLSVVAVSTPVFCQLLRRIAGA